MKTGPIDAAISTKVLALVAKGMNVVDALKAVCGTELVDATISNLYDSLRAGHELKNAIFMIERLAGNDVFYTELCGEREVQAMLTYEAQQGMVAEAWAAGYATVEIPAGSIYADRITRVA